MKIIDKIEIHRFRSISDTLILNDEITIFSGINNSGKSNVLKAINLFFNGESNFGQVYDFEKDYNLAYTGQAGGKRETKITMYFSNQGQAALKKPFWISRTFSYGHVGGYEYGSSDTLYNDKLKKGDGNISRQFTTFLNKLEYFYIPAVRDKDFVQQLFLHFEKLIEYDSGKDFSDKMIELSSILKEKSKDISNDFEKFIKLPTRAALSSKITDILGTIEINVKTGMQIRKRTMGITNPVDAEVSLFSSGDGILMSYLAYFLAHLSKKISKKMFIWGFEEPENSLEYSKVQKLAFEFYENFKYSAQIYITTHSPAFINLKDRKGVLFYRVYTEPSDPKLSSKIKSLKELEARQLELIESNNTDNNEYKKLLEELHFVEYANEIENIVKRISQEEEELKKAKSEFENKIKNYANDRPDKIFICEDKDTRIINLWNHLLNLSEINDVLVLSSEGCTKNYIENWVRQQKKITRGYNPKIFRQIDRDGLTDEQITVINDKLFDKEKKDLKYEYAFLPVCELENFAVLMDADTFTDEFWYNNKEEIINSFEKTADDKCRVLSKNFNAEEGNRKLFLSSGSTTTAMQKMRELAFQNWRTFFPGKEICKKVTNYNFIATLQIKKLEDLPLAFRTFLEKIKNFLNTEE